MAATLAVTRTFIEWLRRCDIRIRLYMCRGGLLIERRSRRQTSQANVAANLLNVAANVAANLLLLKQRRSQRRSQRYN